MVKQDSKVLAASLCKLFAANCLFIMKSAPSDRASFRACPPCIYTTGGKFWIQTLLRESWKIATLFNDRIPMKIAILFNDRILHLPTFKFQARHAVTVPLHAVTFLYTATFHWGLGTAIHCCVAVHLCFTRDPPDTTAITRPQCPRTQPGFRMPPPLTLASGQRFALCFRRTHLPRLGPGRETVNSAIRRNTSRQRHRECAHPPTHPLGPGRETSRSAVGGLLGADCL